MSTTKRIGLVAVVTALLAIVVVVVVGQQQPGTGEPLATAPKIDRGALQPQPTAVPSPAPSARPGQGGTPNAGAQGHPSPALDGVEGSTRDVGNRDDIHPDDPPLGTAWPISKDGIQGAVTEALPAMRDCYNAALDRDDQLAGRLSIGFLVEDIDGIGQVSVVDINDGGITDPDFIDCTLGAFDQLQFDAPQDGSTRVTYPVTFRNDG